MKFLITFCLLASLATVALTSSASWGKLLPYDNHLYTENIVLAPIKNNYLSVNVNFPKSGQINTKNITVIYVYDRYTNNSGAQPTLLSGGPGFRFATINLKSPISRGINSTVQIYGR